jgi:hypothetical protein
MPIGRMHTETFAGVRDGAPILVPCDCAIGRDHSHAEWRERFEPRAPDGSRPAGRWPSPKKHHEVAS